MLLLTKLDRVVDGVLDLANHVKGTLELEVLQAHLNCIQRVH